MASDSPALVLVHGGAHAGDCWDPTIAEIYRQAPDLQVLAVDLPGRRNKPADLKAVTIEDWVGSVTADIDAAAFSNVVIVGHSMAGLTVPGVVARLGPSRVKAMILISAFIPPSGVSLADSLRGPLSPIARMAAHGRQFRQIPSVIARWAFCNGMTRDQRLFTLSRICPDSAQVILEPADRSGLPDAVPRTWVMTTRDRALSMRSQSDGIAALGGVDKTISLDAPHDVMISHPRELAAILIDHCYPVGSQRHT